MRELARDGMTMLVVTHEIGFARDVADTVAVMDGGLIIEVGSPGRVLTDPRHERTRRFLSNVFARSSSPSPDVDVQDERSKE
jgi:polar amino acid transport system ATP-binding protein